MDNKLDYRDWTIALALIIIGLLVIGLTLNDYSLTWDEPTYLDQTLGYLDYFKSLGKDHPFSWSDLPKLFETKDRHPPLHRCLALPFLAAFPDWPRLIAARMATAMFSSLLLAVVYLWGRRRLGKRAAIGASLLLLVMPRFFAHSHLFALDIAIAFWWTTVLWLFYEARHRWGIYALACVAFTAALLTKFTAVLIPGALLLWIMICRYLFRGRRALSYDTIIDWILKLYLILLVGFIGFFLLWPQFWEDFRYHVLNYVTFQMKHYNAGVYYFGQSYWGDTNPPWHYVWVMLLSTLTPIHLLLLVVGTGNLFRRYWDTWGTLVLVSAFFPLLLFSSPTIPKYDGVRLFLNAMPGLALIMGIGLEGMLRWLTRIRFSAHLPGQTILQNSLWVLICVSIAGFSVYRIHPYQLSYFNCFFGGLKGAYHLGFPVTYWGDFQDAIYPDLNKILQPGDNLYVIGTFINIDYPYTTTGRTGQPNRLKSGIKLQKIEKFDPANVPEGRHYILIVQKRSAIPKEVKILQSQLCPIYEFRLKDVPLAQLYFWDPFQYPEFKVQSCD